MVCGGLRWFAVVCLIVIPTLTVIDSVGLVLDLPMAMS